MGKTFSISLVCTRRPDSFLPWVEVAANVGVVGPFCAALLLLVDVMS